jgi:methylase of polypeptide subunit release factors
LASGSPLITVRNPLVEGFAHPTAPIGWDLVVMNPPYVGEKHIRTRLGADLAGALKKKRGFTGDLLVHFALGGLDALCPGGAMSAIVSDTAFTMDTAGD